MFMFSYPNHPHRSISTAFCLAVVCLVVDSVTARLQTERPSRIDREVTNFTNQLKS